MLLSDQELAGSEGRAAPMSRMYQQFEAPGPEGKALPIAGSAWHQGRLVRLPLEHWERLEELVARSLPEFLESWDFFCDLDGGSCSPAQVEAFKDGLLRLRQQVAESEPLTPESNEEIPEALPPEEHQKMLDAVVAVVDECLKLQEPFDSWVD